MMKSRRKRRPDLYPCWEKKHDSPPDLCRQRDGMKCVDCGVEQFTLRVSANGTPYLVYLHGAHVNPLDPDYDRVEPIEGQRLRARCATCHARYDNYWKARLEELAHQRKLHAILLARFFIMRRFTQVE
jgi:hypothetical protein